MVNTITRRMESALTFNSNLQFRCLNPLASKEFGKGIGIGAIHVAPLLSIFIALHFFMTLTPVSGISSVSLVTVALIQFLAPAVLLAYGDRKLHKNTTRMISTGLFLGGACNGMILSLLLS